MTSRIHSLVVVLKNDVREDDVEGLIDAIKYFGAVSDVTTNITDLSDFIARDRARIEIREQISEILWPKDKK